MILNHNTIWYSNKCTRTDTLFVSRDDQIFGLEHDDSKPLSRRKVAERDKQLRPALVRYRIAHHVSPDIDSRTGAAAAKHVLPIG